jgi:hypothetical protein
VEFQPEHYGPDIARILNPAGGGQRLMPLVKTQPIEAAINIESLPGSVLSGLYLYCGCWDAAHSAADRIEDPTGYFWHAIVHRQEPDPANSDYWFRKTVSIRFSPSLPPKRATSAITARATGTHMRLSNSVKPPDSARVQQRS